MFEVLLPMLVSFVLVLVLGPICIPLLRRLKMGNTEREYIKVDFDTIHFSTTAENSVELAKGAKSVITPKPVNYNKVVTSGWV